MDPYPDEEEMEDMRIDDKREHHWRIVFEENNGVLDDEKEILRARRWHVYMNEKNMLTNGGYSVQV